MAPLRREEREVKREAAGMVKGKNTKKGCVLTGEGEEGEIRAKVKERGTKG